MAQELINDASEIYNLVYDDVAPQIDGIIKEWLDEISEEGDLRLYYLGLLKDYLNAQFKEMGA